MYFRAIIFTLISDFSPLAFEQSLMTEKFYAFPRRASSCSIKSVMIFDGTEAASSWIAPDATVSAIAGRSPRSPWPPHINAEIRVQFISPLAET